MIHKTPWFVKEESALWLIENDSDTIAILPKTQHTQSDARLIAAAPDLLTALEALMEAHDVRPPMLTASHWRLARQAIKTARRG